MSDLTKYEGHTPGPWDRTLPPSPAIVQWGARLMRGSAIHYAWVLSPADARLIADAPALLAESVRLRAERDALRADAERYRELRKYMGYRQLPARGHLPLRRVWSMVDASLHDTLDAVADEMRGAIAGGK